MRSKFLLVCIKIDEYQFNRKRLTLIVFYHFAMVYACKNFLQRAGIEHFLFKHFCVAILDFRKTKSFVDTSYLCLEREYCKKW